MNNKIKRGLVSISLASLVLTTSLASSTVFAEQEKVTRIGEADRYTTAAKVATTNWANSDNVVLVSGEGYADAVSASVLAKKLNAPILLTTPETLNTDTKSALATLKPQNIYIVGGNSSIGQSVRDELKNSNYKLIELQGSNRYETNVAVAKKLVDLGVRADNLILVGGEGFSDALAVAPVAAAKEQILLLGSNDDNSMKLVIQFIKDNNSKVTVVGTENIINEDTYRELGAAERVEGGIDRFETNMNVLTKFSSDFKDGQIFVANASGEGYADALVAAALAGKTASPIVLLDTPSSQATTKALEYIKEKAPKTTGINIVGGMGVVSKDTEDAINSSMDNSVQPKVAEKPTVKSIEAVSLNEIKVEFNTAIDYNTAVDVTNYEIDSSKLVPCTVDPATFNSVAEDINAASGYYADPYTIYITLAYPRKQYDNLSFTVKKGILSEDRTQIIDETSKSLTLSDTTAPTIKNVTVFGNSELSVEFSEDVNFKNLNDLSSKFKIDGQSIKNYGVNPNSSSFNYSVTINNTSIGPVGTWGKIIFFCLDSPISTGTHTLKVLDGDTNGVLVDAAGFSLKESSLDFKVDSNSTSPIIKSVIHSQGGQLLVYFDRPMDYQSSGDLSNYELNGKKLNEASGASGFLYDPTYDYVEIDDIPEKLFNIGSNVLYVSDNVKDAYRNKVASDTRFAFDNAEDNTKPTVNSVKLLDSETIRVQYSKIVDYDYASNPSNYKLLDNEGTNITSHIKSISNTVGISDTTDDNCFNIKLNKCNPSDPNDDWRLNSSKYTLAIKNIIDTLTKPNVMDDYTTTINGTDDIAPKVTGIYSKLRSASRERDKVVVYFDENMDSNTLINKDNYRFLNGEGDTKILPQDTTITIGGTAKSAIIEFPSNYNVKTTGKTTTGSAIDVTAITVSNVKDEAGNALDVPYSGVICEAQFGAKVKNDTLRVYYDGDDLKVDVQFDKAIDTLEASDFTLGRVAPSIANISGNKVTLTYKGEDLATASDKLAAPIITFANGKTNNDATTTKIDIVKSQGQAAFLGIKTTPKSTDETGLTIASLNDTLGNAQNTIYSYEAVPKTTCTDDSSVDFWTAKRDTNGTKVYVTFDTPLDKNSGIKPDDFIFTSTSGAAIEADSVDINGNTVVFSFYANNEDYDNALKNATEIGIRIKSTVSLRTIRDADGNNANYIPSDDDLKTRNIVIMDK